MPADQPNVLFIAADDMNCDLGAYGHPLDYDIIAKGKYMKLKINGRTASELIDEAEAHFDLAGHLGLQLRSGNR